MRTGLRIDVELPRLNAMYRHERLGLRSPGDVRPFRIDGRGELLRSSNQRQTSECAAYTMAGAIEYARLRWLDVAEQIDPHPIYLKAKELDGLEGEGTTLDAVIQAAIALGWIKRTMEPEQVRTLPELKAALRKYRVVLGGFEVDDSLSTVQPDGWWTGLGEILGGHAMLVCGLAEDTEEWIGCQGSWGEQGYGWHGFIRMMPDVWRERWCYGLAFDVRPLK